MPAESPDAATRSGSKSGQAAENEARRRVSKREAHSRAAANEARRQASDSEARRQVAANEARRQASDSEALRQVAANEARHRAEDRRSQRWAGRQPLKRAASIDLAAGFDKQWSLLRVHETFDRPPAGRAIAGSLCGSARCQ